MSQFSEGALVFLFGVITGLTICGYFSSGSGGEEDDDEGTTT